MGQRKKSGEKKGRKGATGRNQRTIESTRGVNCNSEKSEDDQIRILTDLGLTQPRQVPFQGCCRAPSADAGPKTSLNLYSLDILSC